MKLLIFISIMISFVLADSYLYPVPLQQLQTPLLVVKMQQQESIINAQQQQQQQQQRQQQQIQQYFTQDNLGQYSYGYVEPLSTKQEIHTVDGVTTGSYSYIDANGQLQTVDYKADGEGFHVIATNLPKNNQEVPQSVTETPEVAAAREQHLAAHKAILQGNPSASSILPKPVEDTTEVAKAKQEFFVRFSAEQEKHKLLQKTALLRNRSAILSSAHNFVQNSFIPSKTKPIIPKFLTPKTALMTDINGFTYGYQFGDVIKPTHYYLPVVKV